MPLRQRKTSQKSKIKERRESLLQQFPGSEQSSDDGAHPPVLVRNEPDDVNQSKGVLQKVNAKGLSSMSPVSATNMRLLRSNTPRAVNEFVKIPVPVRTNDMPLLDESDLDDRFVKSVRSSYQPLVHRETGHSAIASGEEVTGNASTDIDPTQIKTDDLDGGFEDSLQIDAEDDLIDFIEQGILDEPLELPNNSLAAPAALAASSPKIKEISNDEPNQSNNDFLDFLQRTTHEIPSQPEDPCLSMETQAFPTFPTAQADHGLSTLICESSKRVNLLLPLMNTQPIVPISPIVDFDPKQTHSYMQLTNVSNPIHSISQSNIGDINTPQRPTSTFDHTTTTSGLAYTVQSDMTTLIYQLVPGQYMSNGEPSLVGTPTNVYTLGPAIASNQLEIINPDCIPPPVNPDDILQEAMRATFDLESRTDAVSMSIYSTPVGTEEHDEKPALETPPLRPGFREKMCQKFNIMDSVVELTECHIPDTAGRKLRRRTKPTNYDENKSPTPELLSDNDKPTNIGSPAGGSRPTTPERRGKTMYGQDEEEDPILAEKNANSQDTAKVSKGGKGKAHRKRKPEKKRLEEQSTIEQDVNKRIVLKMKRLPRTPNEEDRQKRKKSAAFSSHENWQVDLTTVEDPKTLPDEDIIFNGEIEDEALKLANYIEDSTLNQHNDKLLETPPKLQKPKNPSIELATCVAAADASYSPDNSIPNDISQAPHTSTPIVSRADFLLHPLPSIVSIANRFPENSAHYFTVRESNGVVPLPIMPFLKDSVDHPSDGVLDLSKRTGRNFRPYHAASPLRQSKEGIPLKPYSMIRQMVKPSRSNVVLDPYRVNDLSVNRFNLPEPDRIVDLSVSSTTQTPYYRKNQHVYKLGESMANKSTQTTNTHGAYSFSEPTTIDVAPISLQHRIWENNLDVINNNRKRVGDQLDDDWSAAKRIRTEIDAQAYVETDEEIDIVTLDASDMLQPSMTTVAEIVKPTDSKEPTTIESPSDEWTPSVYRHISIEPPKVQRQNLHVQFNNSPTTEGMPTTPSPAQHSLPCDKSVVMPVQMEPPKAQRKNLQVQFNNSSATEETTTVPPSKEQQQHHAKPVTRPNIGAIAENLVFQSSKAEISNATGPIVKFDMSSLSNLGQTLASSGDLPTTVANDTMIQHNFNWTSDSFPTKFDRSYNSDDDDCISIFAPSIRSPSPELTTDRWFKKPVSAARNRISDSSKHSVSEINRFTDLRSRLNSKQQTLDPVPTPSASSLPLKTPFKIPRLQNTTTTKTANNNPVVPIIQPKFNVSGLTPPSFTDIANAEIVPIAPLPKPLTVSYQIGALFGLTCFRFMRNNCQGLKCPYSHKLPDQMAIYAKLLDHQLDFVVKAYTGFVKRSRKAFEHFFSVFCRRFADFGAIKEILTMLADCECFAMFTLYWEVADMLERCGLPREDAIKTIVANTKVRTIEALKELIEMMVRLDCLSFIGELSAFSRLEQSRFQHTHICQLMDVTLSSKNQRMVQLMFDIINASPNANFILGNSRLEQFYFIVKECLSTVG